MRKVILALCLLFLSFPARAEDVVKFGLSAHPDSLLPLIGQDKGWYKTEGVPIDFSIRRWRDLPDAVATGQVDVAISDLAMVVANHESHPDLVYWYGLSTQDNSYALMVRPGTQFKSVEQLTATLHDRAKAVQAATEQFKGKTVIAPAKSEIEQAVSIVARNAGLGFSETGDSDIHTIDPKPDDGLQAFLAGKGDAYMAPLVQRMLAQKAGMVVILSGADLGAAPIVGMVTTRQYASSHKDDLLKILHVWFKTVNFAQAHPDEVADIVAGEMTKAGSPGFSADNFKASWQTMEHYPLSAEEAASTILSPDGEDYWQQRQWECSEYFCNVAEVLPEEVEGNAHFLMPQVQRDYVAKYGSKAGK